MINSWQYTLFDSNINHAEVTIPYGKLESMVDWCNINCDKKWGYSVLREAGADPGFYSFQFESEKDYVKFIMWKK